MASKQKIYVVYAGNKREGYKPVYKSPKLKKAEDYSHDLMKSGEDYDKVYIATEYPRCSDKRNYE